MSSVYLVKLQLVCKTSDSTALANYYSIWTSAAQAEWATLVYDGALSPTQLAVKLNEKLIAKFGAKIATDTGGTPKSDSISASAWTIGSGGLHSGDNLIAATAGGVEKYWEVAGSATNFPIEIYVEWVTKNVEA